MNFLCHNSRTLDMLGDPHLLPLSNQDNACARRTDILTYILFWKFICDKLTLLLTLLVKELAKTGFRICSLTKLANMCICDCSARTLILQHLAQNRDQALVQGISSRNLDLQTADLAPNQAHSNDTDSYPILGILDLTRRVEK